MKHFFALVAFCFVARATFADDWIRSGLNTNQPLWGLRHGLQFALHPGGFGGGEGGPRGLIRIGAPILPGDRHALVNFIAVEPIVRGQRGFSELERSPVDHRAGKLFQAGTNAAFAQPAPLFAGELTALSNSVELLRVPVRVERFDNGAHVSLTLSQRSDAPDELEITVRAEPDSATIEYCILSATMGNFARTRLLWLKDRVVSSLELYPQHRGTGFAPHTIFARDQLFVTPAGDALVALTTDEEHPEQARPFAGKDSWYYGGARVTQFWRKPAADLRDDLHVAVNARFTYWQSSQPIPGGVAFENFELRERFHAGQRFVFGITRRTPRELGSTGAASDKRRAP